MSNALTTANDTCPVAHTARIVCGKWTLLIIRDLLSGPKYFRDLELSLAGISPRTLCERLRFLAEHDIVSRTYIRALPPRAQYSLTEKGTAIAPVVSAMEQFGSDWLCEQSTTG